MTKNEIAWGEDILALIKNLQFVASGPAPDDAGGEALRCVVGMGPAEEGALFEVALYGAEGGQLASGDAMGDLDVLEGHCGRVSGVSKVFRMVRRGKG